LISPEIDSIFLIRFEEELCTGAKGREMGKEKEGGKKVPPPATCGRQAGCRNHGRLSGEGRAGERFLPAICGAALRMQGRRDRMNQFRKNPRR
jgi:hypothetical protein